MPRLDWSAVGSRFYESGVDRGVLYVDGRPGVAWTGLISVEESSSGGDAKPYYVDGVKYLNRSAAEEFEASITAYTYPEEFEPCNGAHQPRLGLFLMQQRRKSFGLSYRTRIGNDITDEYGYKIHVVYNALASPSGRSNQTLSDSSDPTDLSWSVTTRAPESSGYRRTSHVVIDSRYTDDSVLALVEDALYGTESETATLPTLAELIALFDNISTLTVVDNGDGTWTATAPADVIRMLDSTTFEISDPTAVFIDEVSYNIGS